MNEKDTGTLGTEAKTQKLSPDILAAIEKANSVESIDPNSMDGRPYRPIPGTEESASDIEYGIELENEAT